MCGLLTDEAGAEECPPGGYNAALTEEQALGPGTQLGHLVGMGLGKQGGLRMGLSAQPWVHGTEVC